MQPSSLIFVAIIAIWAAYLMQHWVSRREHLATARSVDRFSEAMRVLDRQRPVVAAATPRSYAVSPVLAVRASSVRAVGSTPSAAPGITAAAAAVAPPAPGAAAPMSSPAPRSAAPVRLASRPMRLLAGTTRRRVRAVAFVVALLAVPVTLVLALTHVLLWVAPAVAVALFVLDLAWLRHAAQVDRRRRIAARVRRAKLAEAAETAAPAESGSLTTSFQAAAAGRLPFGVEPVETAASADAVGASVAESVPESAVELAPGSWQPVPVPPPTYTLKAKAPERVISVEAATPALASAPEALEAVFDNQPVALTDDDFDDVVPLRSVAG